MTPKKTKGSAARQPEVAAQEDDRRYLRSFCSEEAVVRIGRLMQRTVNVKLVDHSETGACLQLPEGEHLPEGEKITITPLNKDSELLPGRTYARLARTQTSGSKTFCGVRFDKLHHERKVLHSAGPRKFRAALVAAGLSLLILVLKQRNIISFWYNPFWQAYSMLAAIYVVSRIGFSMFYEEPEDRGVIKTLSIVLPVKNEEANIEEVVRRCFSARYPSDKLELIVIDDGSTDKTWEALERVKAEFPRLQTHRFEKNKGKRHGMAWGAEHATGEILIFMDSDSLVEPEGFYRIIQPFYDESVGAVAGHTLIIVEEGNTISKMESVRYFVSQRVMKAAESIFGAVTCCPGPFSAYRRDAVMKILPEWLNQTFLGAAATFGDDRSLTNRILKEYNVVYHAGARCSTYAPNTWPGFLKQQLRWKKSWVRETLSTCMHMWREHPAAAISYYLSVVITITSPLAVLRAFVYSPWALGTVACGPYIAGLALVFLLLGVLYYYHTQSRYWYYGLMFAAVYSWIFSIQTYYAMITVRENHWGTR
jgi:hyaluronan synthase